MDSEFKVGRVSAAAEGYNRSRRTLQVFKTLLPKTGKDEEETRGSYNKQSESEREGINGKIPRKVGRFIVIESGNEYCICL